jgi:hypothetical protein
MVKRQRALVPCSDSESGLIYLFSLRAVDMTSEMTSSRQKVSVSVLTSLQRLLIPRVTRYEGSDEYAER